MVMGVDAAQGVSNIGTSKTCLSISQEIHYMIRCPYICHSPSCISPHVHEIGSLPYSFLVIKPFKRYCCIISNKQIYVIRNPLHEHTHKKSTSNHAIYPVVPRSGPRSYEIGLPKFHQIIPDSTQSVKFHQ